MRSYFFLGLEKKEVPGGIQQAVADADTFFRHDLPALRHWWFGPEEARAIKQPVLAVLGENGEFHV